MGHDLHFLQRLDRLPDYHVEVALSLYRDAELVKHLLGRLTLPESAERVAVSLADPVRGPFIIVTREGRFVTCLAEDMRVNIPVVPKETFDAAAHQVQRVRDLMADIAKHPARQLGKVLARILSDGSQVTREEFMSIAAWVPLLESELLGTYIRVAQSFHRVYGGLSRRHTFKRRDDDALHRYWQDCWALGHLSLLLGVDGGATVRRALAIPDLGEALGKCLTWLTVMSGVTSMAARAAWLASRVGKPLIPSYKRLYKSPGDELMLMNAGICLTAIGLSHRRSRAEIGKVLSQRPDKEGDPLTPLLSILRELLSKNYQQSMASKTPPEQIMEELARELYLGVIAYRAGAIDASQDKVTIDDEKFDQAISQAELPPAEVQIADLLRTPFPLIDQQPYTLVNFLLQLRWLAQAKPEAFYIPQAHLPPEPWTPEESLVLLDPRRRRHPPPSPARASTPAPKPPGRNDPCPCGSEKKYKRCCGVQPGLRASAEGG